ncbi:MAG: putative DNA binding domain-containing protein [Bacteroidales bacterium]|nr:putative DNA binding domain-containing protein [Bacteroidales bacterium]
MKRTKYIQSLIEEGEHQQLDFKFEISDARKIARTFVAFANTDGGKLLIGVKDNREIAGIRSEEERFMAEEAVKNFCKPNIEFISREWIINKKVVLEIRINKGADGPYYALAPDGRWLVYIRVKDQNILANKILVRALQRKSSDAGTYINYSQNEKLLLQFLESNRSITFSEFRKMANISPAQTENILVNFLALDILEARFSDDEFHYRLAGDFIAE